MIKKRTQIRVGQSISGLPDLSVASVQRRLTSSISQQIVGSSRFSIDRLPERTIGLHSVLTAGFRRPASMLTALFDVPAFPRFSPWIHFGQNPCRRAARMADVSELAATALRRNEGGNNQLRSRSWQAAARSSKPMEDDCGQPGTCHKARFFSLRYLLVRRDQPLVLALSDMLRRQTILVANRE